MKTVNSAKNIMIRFLLSLAFASSVSSQHPFAGVYEGYWGGNMENTVIFGITEMGRPIAFEYDAFGSDWDMLYPRSEVGLDGSFQNGSNRINFFEISDGAAKGSEFFRAPDSWFEIDKDKYLATATDYAAYAYEGVVRGDQQGFIEGFVTSGGGVIASLSLRQEQGGVRSLPIQTTLANLLGTYDVEGGLLLSGTPLSGTYGSAFETSSYTIYPEPLAPFGYIDEEDLIRAFVKSSLQWDPITPYSLTLGWVDLKAHPWVWHFTQERWLYWPPNEDLSPTRWAYDREHGWMWTYAPWWPWVWNETDGWFRWE